MKIKDNGKVAPQYPTTTRQYRFYVLRKTGEWVGGEVDQVRLEGCAAYPAPSVGIKLGKRKEVNVRGVRARDDDRVVRGVGINMSLE